MSKKIKISEFDASLYLNDEESIAEYLKAVLAEEDIDLFLTALGDITKARGMTQIAKDTGLSRESLYKSLSAEAKPRMETIQKIVKSLGLRFTLERIT